MIHNILSKKMDCILFIHFTDHNLMDMLVSIFSLF